MTQLTLAHLPYALSVCRLDRNELPDWANTSALLNYSRMPEETSLVCESHLVPEHVTAEHGWQCLQIVGVLDFSLIGILARIATLLADKHISIFVVSTYDTDFILVKSEQITAAKELLASNGYHLT